MATRKAGSRRLVVDGRVYRWRIRRRATRCDTDYGNGTLHVAVQLNEDPGALLLLITDRPHPKDCVPKPIVPVRPSDVAGWIREAIHVGWAPATPGPQFRARVVGSMVTRWNDAASG